jgi:hypothetical protein
MELILIIAVAAIILWALSAAAKVREREGGSGCCGGSCHSPSKSDGCGSDSGCGSGD